MNLFSLRRRLWARFQLLQGKVKFAISFLIFTLFIILIDYFLGLAAIILEKDFESDFSYPLDVDNFPALVENFRTGEAVEYEPINRLYSKPKFLEKADSSCDEFQLMVIIVKSAPSNFQKRKAIRSTWGNPHYLRNISNLIRAKKLVTNSNNNRFTLPKQQHHHEPNVYFKLVFIIGLLPNSNNPSEEDITNTDQVDRDSQNSHKPAQQFSSTKDNLHQKTNSDKVRLEEMLRKESETHQDIVRIETMDTYTNNTLKTMMGIRWASEICTDFEYALLVDDDMYISIKNLLVFLESPGTYPDGGELLEEVDSEYAGKQIVDANRLFAGKVLFTKPIRQRIGSYRKWYLSLEEYPYNYFPRYMPAAAIVMSKQVVDDFYYASFYTKHFRFDDIFLGILAYKMNIIPFSSSYFYVCHTEDGKCSGLVGPGTGRKLFDGTGAGGGVVSSYDSDNNNNESDDDLSVVELMEHVIARHGLNPEQLIDLWRELTLAGKI